MYLKYKNTPLIIAVIIILDQLSKVFISNTLIMYETKTIINGFLKFTYITNDGIAFGFNPFSQQTLLFIISVFAILFVIKILFDSNKDPYLAQLGLIFIIGGAIGNLIDRFLTTFNLFNYSGVIDFINIGFNQYYFPFLFNLADSFISIGIIFYIISFLKSKINYGK